MSRTCIIGATSAMAIEVARLLAARGDQLVLAARHPQRLESLARDLEVRGAESVTCLAWDALDGSDPEALVTAAWEQGVDLLLIAHGSLPEQQAVQDDPHALQREFAVNAGSVLLLLARFAPRFAQQGHGVIAVLSSVAGDRGRQSNYVYGSAKAAVSVFLQGLRNRMHRQGVAVVTLKPGFVDTPMTAAFSKGPLWVSPQRAARDILRAVERRAPVAYIPWFWRYIMLIIRLLPERLFKRLSL